MMGFRAVSRPLLWRPIARAHATPAPPLVLGRQLSLTPTEEEKQASPAGRVIYRGRWIKVFRLFVRMKIVQFSGVAAAAIPAAMVVTNEATVGEAIATGAPLVVGAGIAAGTMWFYSRRYVGEMRVLGDANDKLQISTLTFWGHRENHVVKVSDIIPPLQNVSPSAVERLSQQLFIPLEVDGDRQYLVSLRVGHLVEYSELMDILSGKHPGFRAGLPKGDKDSQPSSDSG